MDALKKFSVTFTGGPLDGMRVERLTLPDYIRIPSTGRDRGMEVVSYRRMPQLRDTDPVLYSLHDPTAES